MKNFILAIICCFLCSASYAQFSAALTGNPVVTTGWTYGGNASVNGAAVQLTAAVGQEAGYIYYSTPTNLSACGSFTVEFDFQVAPPPNFGCIADGIAFWYITNPPTGFIAGGGIGLPNDPNGLIMILDTYDNNNNFDNPLATLLGYTGSTNYVEGATTGVIGTNATFLNYVTDGSFHHCKITYNNGALSVYLNNATTASITGTYVLNQTGYFGFSASTGACTSVQSIKNVTMTASPVSPAPTVTSPVTYCQNEVASPLTAGGTNLTWYATLNGTALAGAPTPNTATPGDTWYYVTQNPVMCPSPADSIEVIVNPKPATPAITGNTSYCVGATASALTANGQNILWYNTASGGTGSATPLVPATSAPGITTYYASQTVNGCESSRDSVAVTVFPTTIAAFTYGLHYGCGQDTAVFTNSSLNAASYAWRYGDGTTGTGQNPDHVYTSQGTYQVTLISTSSNGCQDSSTVSITISHAVQSIFATDKDSACVGQPFTFTNTSTGNNLSYVWNFGDGSSSTQMNPQHQYTQGGIYNVTLTTTDFVPCQNVAMQQLVVGGLYVNLGFHDTTICPKDSMALLSTITSVPDGLYNTFTYMWSPADGIGNAAAETPNFFDFGDYTHTLTVTGYPLGCVATDAQVIHSYPSTPLSNVTPSQTIPYGSSIQLNADGAQYYFWMPDDGSLDNPNINYPVATPTVSTQYVVVGLDIHGCRDTGMVSINIDFDMNEGIPSAFSPNGDGRNDVFKVLGLKAQKLLDFRVFNRWGQLLFHTTNPEDGWDGNFNGKPQDVGTYNYVIIIARPDGSERNYTGTITLVR